MAGQAVRGPRAWRWRAAPPVVAVVAALLLPGASVRAAGPYLTGHAGVLLGCMVEDDPNCRQELDALAPRTSTVWEADDELGLTTTGAAMAGSYRVSASEQNAADGSVTSFTFDATVESSLTGGQGRAQFYATLAPHFPVSSDTVSVQGTVSAEAHGTALSEAQAEVRINIGCGKPETTERLDLHAGSLSGEATREDDVSVSQPVSFEVPVVERVNIGSVCTLGITVGANTLAQQSLPPTDLTTAKVTASLTVTAGPPTCDLSGVVRDGNQGTDKHANPLVGVLVELVQDGEPVSDATTTGGDGRYCLRAAAESSDSGDLTVRVRLQDGLNDPPIFHVEHSTEAAAVELVHAISEADFGRNDLDIEFASTGQRPWLPDVANVFWESQRFVLWLTDVAGMDAASLAGLKVIAFSGAETKYTPAEKTATVNTRRSPLDRQGSAFANAPENAEWHEIAHHVGEVLGIAPIASLPCRTREANHGGWTNDSTCDSLAEGFAPFLAVLASVDLDAGRGGFFEVPFYSSLFSVEGNEFAPWSVDVGPGGVRQYREDFAVAQLLWDLADGTPSESSLLVVEARDTGEARIYLAHDRVALTGLNVIQQLAAGRPVTVADLYDYLIGPAAIDPALRTLDVDLDGDGTLDASAIDELFLMHGFRSLEEPDYVVGDPISRTPPGQDQSLSDRRATPYVPGAAIRLRNTGSGTATFTLAISGEGGDVGEVEIAVPAASDLIVDLMLPPYYDGALPQTGELPPCGDPDHQTLTLRITGPGMDPQELDSCEYLHLVVEAVDGAALTLEVAGDGPAPGQSGSPTSPVAGDDGLPAPLIVGAAALVVVAIAALGFLGLRRRRAT